MNDRIINSLLDMDFYKMSMIQLLYLKHRDVKVKYKLFDRSNMRLSTSIPKEALVEQLDAMRQLEVSVNDIFYLNNIVINGKRIFCSEFLDWFESFKLPEYFLDIDKDDNFIFEVDDGIEGSLWETLVMSTLSELYYTYKMKGRLAIWNEETYAIGIQRLANKMARISAEAPGLTYIDFGTRRRFSFDWQYRVVELIREFPQFIGTSNVFMAREFDIPVKGTMAHEMDMIYSGIYRDRLRESHQLFLKDWQELYSPALLTALTDTYTSEFFFKDFTKEQAELWDGVRHDSKDPFKFSEKTITFYTHNYIDPKTKSIVYSDKLDDDLMIRLYKKYNGRININTTNGWGTNLTNDLGYMNLNIVVKAVEANGYGCVKLSDDAGKEMGTPEDIRLFKETFTK